MQKRLIVAALLAAAAQSAGAQTIVVTGPGTQFTNAGPSNAADPACPANGSWCARNVRNNGAAGITTALPRSGNGSIQFNGPTGQSYKADFEHYLAAPDRFTLSSLQSFGYDWYRSSTSTAPNHLAPSVRLILSDFSYLVYEPALNGTPKNTIFAQPTNAWQTNVFGDNGYVWWTAEGTQLAYSIADWKTGRTAANGRSLNGSATVIGFSTGVGSGWSGSFDGAVDNVTYQTSAMNQATTFNFETQSVVPEPSTYALFATGLVGLLVVRRRRQR